jgi:hypothetical protein
MIIATRVISRWLEGITLTKGRPSFLTGIDRIAALAIEVFQG